MFSWVKKQVSHQLQQIVQFVRDTLRLPRVIAEIIVKLFFIRNTLDGTVKILLYFLVTGPFALMSLSTATYYGLFDREGGFVLGIIFLIISSLPLVLVFYKTDYSKPSVGLPALVSASIPYIAVAMKYERLDSTIFLLGFYAFGQVLIFVFLHLYLAHQDYRQNNKRASVMGHIRTMVGLILMYLLALLPAISILFLPDAYVSTVAILAELNLLQRITFISGFLVSVLVMYKQMKESEVGL